MPVKSKDEDRRERGRSNAFGQRHALFDDLVSEEERRPVGRRLSLWLLFLFFLLSLAALWRWTPLGEWLDVEALVRMVSFFKESGFGPFVAIGVFLLGGLLAMPVTVLIVATASVFGPYLGFAYSLIGAELSALLTYGIGHRLGRDAVRRFAGSGLNRLSQRLAKRGIWAVIFVRIVPVAPYTVVNMVAGASHIRLRDFTLGTLLGIAPGTLAMAVFTDSILTVIQDPQFSHFAILALVGALIVLATLGLRAWLLKRKGPGELNSPDA